MRNSWFIILLFLSFSLSVSAQIGTRFWFAAPSLTHTHDESMNSQYAKFCFSTYEQAATITISQPGIIDRSHPRYFAPYTITLPANSTVDVLLSHVGINRAEARKSVPYGIYIESDENISVYFAQVNNNSEVYTLKGQNALGLDFIVGMQRTLPNAHGGLPSVEITATEDNTIVNIESPVVTANNPNRQWSITLQKGEVYTIVGANARADAHLAGMHITSNRPIVVNSTDDSVSSWGQDLCGDQLVPTNLAGTEYVAFRNTAEHEKIYVYAVQDGTQLSFNGQPQQILNRGETRIISLTEDVNYIQSDNHQSFVVWQLTGVDGETGASQLPKLSCTGSSKVVYVRRFASAPQVTIIVKTEYTAYFKANNNNQITASDFQPLTYAPQWSWCRKNLTPERATGYLKVSNDSTEFQMSVLDCDGGTCTFGYFSDYNAATLYPIADKEYYTIGETIHLSLQDSVLYNDIQWTLPDGSRLTGSQVTVTAQAAHNGFTYVKAVSREGCSLAQDSFPILIHILESQRIDSTVCDTLGIAQDSVELVPTLRPGYNILSLTNDTSITCTAQAQEVWRASAEVRNGQRYQVDIQLASANNTRRPRVEVKVDQQTVGNTIFPTTTATPISFEWTATTSGTAVLAIHTVQGSTNNSTLLIGKPSFAPLFEVNDSIVYSLIECLPVTPDTTPVLPPDTTPVLPPDTTPVEPPVEPPVTYNLQVALDTYDCTICDGDLVPEIPYTIIEGEVHQIDVNGTWENYSPSQTIVYNQSFTPGTYTLPLVFCDTTHQICTDALVYTIRVLYQPLQIFTQKWDNTLVAYNIDYSGYQLDLYNYQWYRNGQAISGAQQSFLYMENGFTPGDSFYLTATFRNAKGEEEVMQTCPYIPVPIAPAQTRIYRLDGTMVNEISSPGFYIITNGTYQQKIITQ